MSKEKDLEPVNKEYVPQEVTAVVAEEAPFAAEMLETELTTSGKAETRFVVVR